MKLQGLKVKEVLELNLGFFSVILEDGTQIITQIIVPQAKAIEDDDSDDDSNDDSDDGEGKKPPKPTKQPKPEPETSDDDDDDDDDDDEITWSDLKAMDEDELKDLVDDEAALSSIDPEDYDDDLPGFRKAIAKKLKIEIKK